MIEHLPLARRVASPVANPPDVKPHPGAPQRHEDQEDVQPHEAKGAPSAGLVMPA